MSVINWIKKMNSLCGPNFKYIYLIFILYFYMLTDCEDGLEYPFERTRISTEFIASNLIVV
jgi:hypothetical protein